MADGTDTGAAADQTTPAAAPVTNDKIHEFFTETDFRLDWTRRRQVIRWSLLLLGGLYAITHLAVTYGLLHQAIKGSAIDPNFVFLATTLCYTDSALAASIIMSYVFGANADVKDLRSKMTTVVSQAMTTGKPT